MAETTRRQFLEVAATAAAASVLAPAALAKGQSPGALVPPGSSPLPVGPGAAYVGYQSEIYLTGMTTGATPIFTTNSSDLEEVAGKVLSAAAQEHLLAWAGGAAAARANARALRAWRIVPRMFIDRAERDHTVTVLGTGMPAPVILGPVGEQALAHRDAESASARAAADLGLTYVHAAQSSQPLEVVAAAAPAGSRWFALDWPGGSGGDPRPALTRARLAGCTHLVLSPPQPGAEWRALAAVRDAWDGPIVLGGIQTVKDARTAVRHEFDGIVVSNERGRRGAAPRGTIHALPRIADAVGGSVAVLFGSGVRTGADVYRALCLGADAVLVGRPYVHGLALGGADGVRHMLRTLLAELDITRAIAGSGDYSPGALLRA